MRDNLFPWACKEIDEADKELGHKLSWRFLTTPSRTLSPSSRVAFIALNPGGDKIRPDHGKESCESGCAYYIEDWKSPLQQQVQLLFKEIAACLKVTDYKSLMDSSLMAYYIPFRSPNYGSLHRQKESRAFAFQLWAKIMQDILPELIISIGWITFNDMHKILTTLNKMKCTNRHEMPTGWGSYKASINCYVGAKKRTVLVRFPHLSRFKIFNRPNSSVCVARILEEMTKFII